MNIMDYYDNFKNKVMGIIDSTLSESNPFYPQLAKNRSFVEDYDRWLAILSDNPEIEIYRNAIKVYQEAFGNMLMGLYQPAFMGLRYFLERSLTGVYYSGSEVELRTWMQGQRDTYWAELIGAEENNTRPTPIQKASDEKNVDKGLFSLRFTRAFFPEIDNAAKSFRALTITVYRNCSEYVHGNPHAIKSVGFNIDYSAPVVIKWNDFADTVARCVLYAFFMRYWHFINADKKETVIERIRSEFSATDIIKDYID